MRFENSYPWASSRTIRFDVQFSSPDSIIGDIDDPTHIERAPASLPPLASQWAAAAARTSKDGSDTRELVMGVL
jgi:hypothetical protein